MKMQRQAWAAFHRLLQEASAYSTDVDALNSAADFQRFKLQAAADARDEIIGTIKSGVTSMRYMPDSLDPRSRVGPITVETQDRRKLDRLRMYLDLYLVELVGVGDALSQLVNATFDLKLPTSRPSSATLASRSRPSIGSRRLTSP